MRKFSTEWTASTQPRKQRKYRYNAPGHIRQKMLSAMLDKPLRKESGRRNLQIRKGDEIVVMRGEFRKTRGTVSRVDTKLLKIYIENIKRKKVSGKETEVPIDPSNVKIIKLVKDAKRRANK